MTPPEKTPEPTPAPGDGTPSKEPEELTEEERQRLERFGSDGSDITFG
jgi:hypothetical protein